MMIPDELLITGVIFGTFLAVALLVAVIGLRFSRRARIRERLSYDDAISGRGAAASGSLSAAGPSRSARTEKILGLDGQTVGKLRLDLIRAGFFSPNAVAYFTIMRAAIVLVLPALLYFSIPILFPGAEKRVVILLSFLGAIFGYVAPPFFLKRAQLSNTQRYRNLFPDFLDLLLVCVDAGLSLEAALERVASEMGLRDRNFAANLDIMRAEMRAGRSTADALEGLAGRLTLEEAQSFTMLLRQSLELGTDVSSALRTFSEEMRDKRLSRAEAKAYALPVKLVLPLGLFIFPVLMIAILSPAVLKMMKAMKNF